MTSRPALIVGSAACAWTLLMAGCATPKPAKSTGGKWERARVDAALAMADEQIAGGQMEQARQSLALAKNSPDPRVQVRLARLELERGEYEAVLRRLDGIAEEERATAEYQRLRAVALEGLGRWGDAAAAYARTYALEPGAEVLLGQVEALAADDQLGEARAVLERERGRYPGHPAIDVLAGALALRAGDASAAVQNLAAARVAEPQSRDIRQRLAEALHAANRPAEAVPLWRELAADVSDPAERQRYQRGLAAALALAGQAEEAHQLFAALAGARPENPELKLELAAAALAAGDPAAALDAAQAVLRARPNDNTAHLLAALGYRRLNQPEQAARELAAVSPDGATGALAQRLRERW